MRAESATAALRRAEARPRRVRVVAGLLACCTAVVAAGCGGTPRQDENEPEAEFPVEVSAEFPQRQALAKDSQLTVRVRNAGEETIPEVNVKVDGFSELQRDPTDPSQSDPRLANPIRPVFVVKKSPVEFLRERAPVNQSLIDREVNPPAGQSIAYTNTYSLGELEPDETANFRWNLSAVDPGPYKLDWRVNAGLHGRAVAVLDDGGGVPEGSFEGVIDSSPPLAKVDEDGETVITSDGRQIRNQRGVEPPRSQGG